MKIQSIRRPLSVGAFVLCAVALPARFAHAHFLWAKVDAKSGPTFQLALAEASSEMDKGVAVDKIKSASAWDEKGGKLALTPAGTMLSGALSPESQIAGATQHYGVLDKTKAGRGVYLLEYHAKAAQDVAKAGRNARLPLEFFARRDGGDILVTLKHNGKPVPFGAVTLHTPEQTDDKGTALTTDAQGQLRFKAEAAGLYGLRAGVAETTAGTFEGKDYKLIRRYTTLSFPVNSGGKVVAPALAAPAKMGNENADPKAYALLEAAHNARQVAPTDFAGYTAKISFRDGDKKCSGTVTYDRSNTKDPIQLNVAGLDEEAKAWLEDTVGNQIGHRRGGSFAQGDGRNPLTLGDTNSFGTLIKLNDRLKSEYRVRDNKVTEVTREMGDSRFTISVIETQDGDPGKYMSTHFTVVYRNKTTGAITQVDGFHDAYTEWNKVWLPEERMVMTFGDKETPRLRTILYSDFTALKK